MKKKVLFTMFLGLLLALLFILTACVDFTVYPEDGTYICNQPYIYFTYKEHLCTDGIVEFEGEMLEADINLFLGSFNLVTSSYAADRYYNASWKLDKDGNIMIKLRESKETFLLVKQ